MQDTRVDDMLIEMISPKVKEIEEKFSAGKGLNQEDINTLLLKSQYNHINHLDMKLNEVTADVAALRNEFSSLKNSVNNQISTLRNDFLSLKGEFKLLKEELEHSIQKGVNKSMMILILAMGFFLTLSKVIEKF
jgi:uncharacterized coiled-coil DUF342 family protein